MRGILGLALALACCVAQAGGPNDFWTRPNGVRPWIGTKLGTEDEVPPPWTKPESSKDGYRCWGRAYAFGGAGLVTSVMSAGQELLASPIALEVNGRSMSFSVRRTTAGVSFADYELVPNETTVPLVVRLHAEFDGFLWFDVTWGGRGSAEVRDLKVRFPVKREAVIALDRCRGTRDDQPLPPGRRGEWSYNPLDEPYFWLGNDLIGMMGGIDTLRGWHLADKSRGYRLHVTDKVAELVMTVVDRAVTPETPRTFGFYVEATPTKPKNLESAALPAESLERWCQVDTIFDFKWPGYYNEDRCEKLRKLQHEGKRVFYYGSTTAVSPNTPLWERYGADWTSNSSPTSGIVKSMSKTEEGRRRGSWTRGCMNCRDFFEYKLYSAARFLNDPKYEVMDLYYDVAEPWNCRNAAHGCVWTDAFGTVCRDFQLRNSREFHKRLLRILKRKNPKGVLYGHSGPSRTPSDVFFERMVMGENYAYGVKDKESYFDVLTPDELRIKYASRSNETVIDMLPQIIRAFQMRRPERLKTYDVNDPVADRAIRHCAAYYKIYDLNIWGNAAGRFDGNQWIAADNAVTRLGPDRRYRAYYHADAPLRALESDARFLWAVFSGKGDGLLILLNDTDETVTRTLSGSMASFGVSATEGRDVFGNGTYAFADGKLTVTLPPREARFIEFRKVTFAREDPAKYWDFAELSKTPPCRVSPYAESDSEGLKALLVRGKGPNGSEAEFFCYYGVPEGKSPVGGWPGVVLVHGGGGTAYPEHVRRWTRDGFAVIALDWYNRRPTPAVTNAVPGKKASFARVDLPGGFRQDHVANVANMVLAHSLLRSFPEVDPNRTVFVGLSWGSWYGACVAAVDGRFKGCVEIYCGDKDAYRNPKGNAFFVNGRFLHAAKVPMWWAVSTNDQNVSPDTSNAGFDECATFDGCALVVDLPHSHCGFGFDSVHRMAAYYAGMEPKRLPRLGTPRIADGRLSADILDSGKGVACARIAYTTSNDPVTHKRKWKYAPAETDGRTVSAKIPKETVQCFLAAYEGNARYNDLCGTTTFVTPWRQNGPETRLSRPVNGTDKVVFLGDSVARDRAAGWAGKFAGAVNLAVPGDCADDLLCRLDHGLLDGVSPKAIVLAVGTDNASRRGNPLASPLDTILDTQSVLDRLAESNPEGKVILLPVSPWGAPPDASAQARCDIINAVLGRLADGDRILWCADGDRLTLFVEYALGRGPKPPKGLVASPSNEGPQSVRPDMRLCWLGIRPWKQKPRFRNKRAEVRASADRRYDAIWIGDSITHFWEQKGNADVFREKFGSYRVLNLGFAGDRTENLLWDILYGGYLDDVSARIVTLMIGTNNAWKDSAEEIAAGIGACLNGIREKQPQAKVLLLSLLPREVAHVRGGRDFRRKNPGVDEIMPKLMRVNELIRPLANGKDVIFVDLATVFTDAEGLPDITLLGDGTHPNAAGYQAWADAVLPLYRRILDGEGRNGPSDSSDWSMR